MSLEKLLKNTKYKDDAFQIARQFQKVGITTLERVPDAPGLMRATQVWGHPLSEVIRAIKEAAEKETHKPLKTEFEVKEPVTKPATGENK